jgi:hypothetical protein
VDYVLHEAVGHSGHIQLLPDRVRITRPGIMAGLSGNTDRDLPLDEIQHVELRDAGRHVNGWIRFVIGGDYSTPLPISHLVVDPYTVFFTYAQRSDFHVLRDELNYRLHPVQFVKNGRALQPPPTA